MTEASKGKGAKASRKRKAAPRKRAAKASRKRKAAPRKRGKAAAAEAQLVSVRAAARELGVSHTAVQKAITTGRLESSVRRRANGRGYLVDVAAARAELAEKTDQSQAGKGGNPKRSEPSTPGPLFGDEKAPPPADPADGEPVPYQVARARREFFRAEQEELEYRRRRGELVERKEEERAGFEVGRQVRDRLVALADTLAPRVIGRDDLAQVRNLILDEATGCAEELWKRLAHPADLDRKE